MRISLPRSALASIFTPATEQYHEWLETRAKFHTHTSAHIYFHSSFGFEPIVVSVACLVWWQMMFLFTIFLTILYVPKNICKYRTVCCQTHTFPVFVSVGNLVEGVFALRALHIHRNIDQYIIQCSKEMFSV